MANQSIYLSRPPLTKADLMDDQNVLPIPDDILQLQVDTLNVYQGLVPMESFDAEYQTRIMNYYRFSATRMNTNNSKPAPMTITTMDLL